MRWTKLCLVAATASAALLVGCTPEPRPKYMNYMPMSEAPPELVAAADELLAENATIEGFVATNARDVYRVHYRVEGDPVLHSSDVLIKDRLTPGAVFQPR